MSDTLPLGMVDDLIALGWNAKIWKQVSGNASPVLQCTFKEVTSNGEPRTVSLSQMNMGVQYSIPDGADITPNAMETYRSSNVYTSSSLHIATSIDADFSESIGLTGFFSEQASVSMKTASNFETNSECRTIDESSVKVIYDFSWRDWRGSVNPVFVDEASKYLENDDRSNDNSFFETWGTHFLVSGHFGGTWTARTSVDANEVSSDLLTAFATAVSESYSDGIEQEAMEANVKSSFEKATGIVANSITVNHFCEGGSGDTSTYDNWLSQVESLPKLLIGLSAFASAELSPKFAPISDLLPDKALGQKLRNRIESWLGCVPFESVPSVEPEVLTIGQHYSDAKNTSRIIVGLIAAGAEADGTTNRNSAQIIPSVDAQLAAVAGAAVDTTHWNSNKNVFRFASVLGAIPPGVGFIIRQPTLNGNASTRLVKYDVSALFGFEPAVSLQLGQVQIADRPGLAIGCISSDTDGIDSVLSCVISASDSDHSDASFQCWAGAQVRLISGSNMKMGTAGFIVPIADGERVKIGATLGPTQSLQFLPLSPGRSLKKQELSGGWSNAGPHGTFISVYLHYDTDSTFDVRVGVYVSDVPIKSANLVPGGSLHSAEAHIAYRSSWFQGIFQSTGSTFVPPGRLFYVDTSSLPPGVGFQCRIYDVVAE